MKIEKDKVVVLTYTLVVDGQVADKATSDSPLDYIHGNHVLLPKFESELEGKEPGDCFSFTLSPEDGYGAYDDSKRFDIPKSSFEEGGKLREDLLVTGNFIPMFNSSGHVVHGRIVEVKEKSVTMDFNLPLAGKGLSFSGEILSVRDSTEKERLEGLHGEFLPPPEHHCCHGKGGCHHGEGHGEGGCCHHGEGHGDGECCHHGEGHEGCCHHGEGN